MTTWKLAPIAAPDENMLGGCDSVSQYGKNRWNYIFLTLAIGLSIYSIVCTLHRIFTGAYMDFIHFYKGAGAIVQGAHLYESGSGGYIYPPFFAFMLMPLAQLPYKTAACVWFVINILLILTILFAGLRILAASFQLSFNRWQTLIVCLLAVILTYDQVRGDFVQGQCDTVVLAGLTLALLWIDRKPFIAGALLGLTALIKYQAIFFLPFLLFRGRWKVAAALVVGAIAAMLLPALAVGWDRNLEYLGIAFRGLTNMGQVLPLSVDYAARIPKITWFANISITSGLARIFADHGLPESAVLISVIAIAGLVVFGLWRIFRHYGIPFFWRSPDFLGNPQKEMAILNLEWCALLMGMLIFSPQCIKRHTLLLLNVNLLALALMMFPRPRVKRWPILAGLIIAQLGYNLGLLFPQSIWTYIGGPCWMLLPFLLLLMWGALDYYHDKEGQVLNSA